MKENSLYVEKFRPDALENFLCSDDVKEKVAEFIKNQDIPNLILSGGAGIGKTTLAKLLVKQIDCGMLYINASDENGIQTVREKIKGFASTASFKKLKIIILDEADYLTTEAQSALRNIIEAYSTTTRFIFTCNFPERIIEPLHSRLYLIDIKPASERDVIKRVVEILKIENIKFEKEDVINSFKHFYPDMRRLLNHIQTNIVDSVLKIKENSLDLDYKEEILAQLMSPTKSTFKEIRKIIAENDIRDFSSLYRCIFDAIEVLPEKSRENTILNIAKYQHMDNFKVDKEINFCAFILEII